MQAPLSLRGSTIRGACRVAAWGAVLSCALLGQVQAQSRYVMSTLTPATSYKGVDGKVSWWHLDDQDRVLGATSYFVRNTVLLTRVGNSIFPKFVTLPTFSDYLVRWPASTAPVVAGAKLGTKQITYPSMSPSIYLAIDPAAQGASPSGENIYIQTITSSTDLVTDPNGKKLLSVSSSAQVYGVNDKGAYFGHAPVVANGNYTPAIWPPGQAMQALPTPGFNNAIVMGLSTAGVAVGGVSGVVSDPLDRSMHAVRWVNGTFEVLDSTVGLLTQAVRVSSNGHVLIQTMSEVDPLQPFSAITGINYRLLLNNGQAIPIDCGQGRGVRYLHHPAVNASGMAVATCVDILDFPKDTTNRAAIWRDGVMSDLTAYLAAKGVPLPSGAILTQALSLNDKGSILAEMKDAAGKFSYVRFTAVP